MIPSRFFIASTGTDSGKTWLTRALTRALSLRNYSVLSVKPIETGCFPIPEDAVALAKACGKPQVVNLSGFYRTRLPLSPWAASLTTGDSPPDIPSLVNQVISLARDCDFTLVESAGGLLTPVTAELTMADFAKALSFPLVVVAADQLGALSHSISLFECANSRRLLVSAFVLMQHRREKTDTSIGSNYQILSDRFSIPVVAFPFCSDDDDALAAAAQSSGLLEALGL